MAASPASSARPPRLNPFAFPSDTDFRFILLVVAVLAVSMFMYNWVFVTVHRDEYLATFQACALGSGKVSGLPEGAGPNFQAAIDQGVAQSGAYNLCMAPLVQQQNAWKLGGIALLLLVAALIYWFFPVWKMRRERFEPLTAEDAPAVLPALHALCQQTGVKPIPQFVWNPLNPAISALAFGRLGRYTVALSGGLIIQFAKDRAAFDATLRHELAHLRNADVDKTYLTVAITWAFVAVAIVPFAITLLMRPALGFVVGITWRVAALIALVYLIRNAFLRAREMYADVRASTWDGTNGALDRVVAALPATPTGRWRSLWLTHPTPAQRRQALADTRILLRLGFWDAFAVGAVTAIALRDVEQFIASLIPANVVGTLVSSALVFSPLIVGVVGLAAWRATFSRVADGARLPSVKAWALGLGIGLAFGLILGLGSALSTGASGAANLLPSPDQVAFMVLWAMIVIVGLLVFLRWLVACAGDWLRVTLGDASPRRVYILGLLLAAVVLAAWLGPLYFAATYAELFGGPGGLFAIGVAMAGFFVYLAYPALTLLLAALWAYPLASAFWRRTSATAPGWVFLDPAPPPSLPVEERVQLRRILLPALLLGLVYTVLAWAIRSVLGSLFSDALASDASKLMVAYGLIILGAVLQAVLAFYVVTRTSRQPIAQALFAAFAAGVVMSIGFLAVNKLRGGDLDLFFVETISCSILNFGALLSLPVVLIANAVARPKARVEPPRTPAEATVLPS